MSEPSPGVSAALLAVAAAPEAHHAERFASLSEDQCAELAALAQRTRTAPLIHRAATRAGTSAGASAALTELVADHSRFHALQSLKQGKALARVLGVLRGQGMAPIALKGAALAFRDYPQPQLRPLRDIDLLLPVEQAIAARELLLAEHQFEPHPGAGRYGPERTHQLPEIWDAESGLILEFHHRINATGWAGEEQLVELLRTDCREIDLLGEAMRVPGATANLLHLVEHATLHHLLGNGPLILSDLHYLAQQGSLDWDEVAKQADSLGLGRALALVAGLTRRHGAEWPAHFDFSVDAELIDIAEYGVLAEEETASRHALAARQAERGEGGSKLAPIARAFKPNPYELARLSRHSVESPARWLGYPAWLREKGARYLGTQFDRGFSERGDAMTHLRHWLAEG